MNEKKLLGEASEYNLDISDFYNDLKQDVLNVSYWFPKIENCGIKVPQTFIKEIPVELFSHLFLDHPEEDIDYIYNWVKNELMPSIPDDLRGLIFIKNGAFSNKFDFSTCSIRCNPLEITRSIAEINYASLMFDTGGNTEIVIRERIPFDERITPTIYHGMPLRNEYRVFYDFDNRKALYIANYWDWDYCHELICKKEKDKNVYEKIYSKLHEEHERLEDKHLCSVSAALSRIEDLSGIWSVDFILEENRVWLIDMALGECSAYYEPSLIKTANV